MTDAPREIQELASERAERRAAKDFAGADELRDRIVEHGMVGRRRARRLAAGADRDPHGGCPPADPRARRRIGPRRTRHGRRVDPLGRRRVAARRPSGDRFVPRERRRSRRALRRRRRHGGAGCDLGRRRRGRSARAGDRLGRGAQRRAEAVAGQDRPGDGRLRRGDRRRPRSARGRARRSHRRRVRSVRHRDPRPPRVRRDRRAGGGRHRGLLHGVPARDPHRRPACSTRSSAGTGRRTSSSRSGSRIWDFERWSFPFRWSVTSIGCGSRRRRRIARGGRSGTSTGSSIGGATGTT